MATFLSILGGLILFNFILLKFSIQSVDTDKKKGKSKKVRTSPTIVNAKTKTTGIAKAA